MIHLTEQIETKTMEEDEDALFKLYALYFYTIYRALEANKLIYDIAEPSYSDLTIPRRHGKNEEQEMCDC